MQKMDRRHFIKISTGFLAAAVLPAPAMALARTAAKPDRRLSFYNTHTRETLEVCYCSHAEYDPDALERINYILRDHRTGDIQPIDTDLLDILFRVSAKVGTQKPFHIISGYRSPATNAMLRRTTSGVAKTSFHTKGRAIDIRLPGYDTRRLRQLCIKLRTGGVGYYAKSNFVHLDTGPIRSW